MRKKMNAAVLSLAVLACHPRRDSVQVNELYRGEFNLEGSTYLLTHSSLYESVGDRVLNRGTVTEIELIEAPMPIREDVKVTYIRKPTGTLEELFIYQYGEMCSYPREVPKACDIMSVRLAAVLEAAGLREVEPKGFNQI